MKKNDSIQQSPHFNVNSIDFISVFDRYDDGVIITDRDGFILYYNQAQSLIDEISIDEVVGKKVTDIYQLSPDTSMILLCMQRGIPMRNKTFFYKTIKGKVVNTIHSVFPILRNDKVTGSICFVRDYKVLNKTTAVVSVPDIRDKKVNRTRYTFGDILGSNPELSNAINISRDAANSSSPIMIIGETGTGKELFAQSIHNHSKRNKKKFTAINCAAIPEPLLEGILFGTEKGAFTGAVSRAGLLEQANGSTIFLDELLSMPVNLQAKLLRVLQEKRVHRIGSDQEIKLNIKIISSINKPPRKAIQENELRMDLFYRLGVVMVNIPPLRSRSDDIPLLINHFIIRFNTALGTSVKNVSKNVLNLFKQYSWPGNIRELEHLIEGAMNSIGYNEVMELKHFSAAFDSMEGIGLSRDITTHPTVPPTPDFNNDTVRLCNVEVSNSRKIDLIKQQQKYELQAIRSAMAENLGNVTTSAKQLGISRQLLHYKMRKYGILRSDFH